MIPALRNLSFDGFLANDVKPRDELLIPVLAMLAKRTEDLLSDLAAFAKISQAGRRSAPGPHSPFAFDSTGPGFSVARPRGQRFKSRCLTRK